MIIKHTTTYRCEHCRRLFEQRAAAERHEDRCKKNPDNFRKCFSCVYLSLTQATSIEDGIGVNTFFCRKNAVYLHTPINKKKGRIYDIEEGESVCMPVECDDFDATPDSLPW